MTLYTFTLEKKKLTNWTIFYFSVFEVCTVAKQKLYLKKKNTMHKISVFWSFFVGMMYLLTRGKQKDKLNPLECKVFYILLLNFMKFIYNLIFNINIIKLSKDEIKCFFIKFINLIYFLWPFWYIL